MLRIREPFCDWKSKKVCGWAAAAVLSTCLLSAPGSAGAEQNLLKNPGFEETAPSPGGPPGWGAQSDSEGKAVLQDTVAHAGRHGISIAPNTSVEQRIDSVKAGAYIARCWVKSEAEQPVTFLLRDPERPWTAYTCTEIKVPRDQWVQIEAFCALDQDGPLTLSFGGTSTEFRFYHGVAGVMTSPIVADDFELFRYEPKPPAGLAPIAAWDVKKEPGAKLDWSVRAQWSPVNQPGHTFAETPVIQARQLLGTVRKEDGAILIDSVQEGNPKPRCLLVPVPAIAGAKCSTVSTNNRTGIRVSSDSGEHRYTAWFTSNGLVTVEAKHVPQFQVRDLRLRYGLLPSFTGTDLCYAPEKMLGRKEFNLPSTQWFVGLRDGNDSMLVAVWEKDTQPVSLGLTDPGGERLIDSLSIGTETSGFSLSFVEHPGIWHLEPLKEDWLGEYVPIGWERPFPARWMSHFFVTTGGEASFREPCMAYSFPIADAKTRMWGVWFEDWNHYPFFFEGPKTIFHFEKTFVPNANALIYFLEPAAADLFSPCEIVEQALGQEKAQALFDFDANRIRKLSYSTPNEFRYDRPVCATTTRLSKIKQEEKPTVGVNLATHLYEFIREIRGRVDQYGAYFNDLQAYLSSEKKAHPELKDYLTGLAKMVEEAQSKSKSIYATPLSTVQEKVDAMKKLLQEGKGDGFDCGQLDVRSPAGAQDDLCRRYNRLVLRLTQTAALSCGDSPEKAIIAKHIWDQSRAVLRQGTRWEPRRTLYFFEP